MKEIEFIGKTLLINSDGKRILVIGDLHLGYEEALNESGVYIGRRMFKEYTDYLDRVFDLIGKNQLEKIKLSDNDKKQIILSNDDKLGETNGVEVNVGNSEIGLTGGDNKIVDEIVLLGDVKHVIGSVIGQEWNDVLGFLDYLAGKTGKIVIVKGQHDALLEPILQKRKDVELLEYYISGKYAFVHGDKEIKEIEEKEIEFWVMGNGHSAVKISDGTKIEKYKCFLVGKFKEKEVIICPSFLSANEGTDPREYEIGMAWKFDYLNFKVVVVGEDLIDLDFGGLGKLE